MSNPNPELEKAIADYQYSGPPIPADVVTVSGPSCSGKDTIMYASGLHKPVGFTTRQPRSNEIEGIDYHFLTEEEVLEGIWDKRFIKVSSHMGAYYGYHCDAFSTKVWNVTDEATRHVKRLRKIPFRAIKHTFLVNPNIQVHMERFNERQMTQDQRLQRLEEAISSITFALMDVNMFFIVNNSDPITVGSRLREFTLADWQPSLVSPSPLSEEQIYNKLIARKLANAIKSQLSSPDTLDI